MNHDEAQKVADNEFRKVILRDIPYFHRLHAKYGNPQFLEIVRNLEETYANLKNRTYINP